MEKFEPEELTNDIEAREESDPLENLSKKELKDVIEKALSDLDVREKEIIELRYGLKDGVTHTFNDIGLQLDIGVERVRQIEHKALLKLNKADKEKGTLNSFLEPQWYEDYISTEEYAHRTNYPDIKPGEIFVFQIPVDEPIPKDFNWKTARVAAPQKWNGKEYRPVFVDIHEYIEHQKKLKSAEN